MMNLKKRICELEVKTVITCILEDKCIPEIVNKCNGKSYVRSPKAKNIFTKYLKNKIPKSICQ